MQGAHSCRLILVGEALETALRAGTYPWDGWAPMAIRMDDHLAVCLLAKYSPPGNRSAIGGSVSRAGGAHLHQSALAVRTRRGDLGYEQHLFRARVGSDVVCCLHNAYLYCRGLRMDFSAWRAGYDVL